MEDRSIELPFVFLGERPFDEMWREQEALRAEILAGHSNGRLLLVEHPPTISVGRGERGTNLLVSEADLRARGYHVVETNRGGKVTYHGPGQLVAYPVLSLRSLRRGVKDFVCGLEQVMIELLARFNLSGERRTGWPGVYVGGRKIGSIGIHVRRQVTIHGLAFNVRPDLADFNVITPCGIPDIEMTSLAREGVDTTVREVVRPFTETFAAVFGCRLHEEAVVHA